MGLILPDYATPHYRDPERGVVSETSPDRKSPGNPYHRKLNTGKRIWIFPPYTF